METSTMTLCLVTDFQRIPYNCYHSFLMEAISGGITSLQLRDKTLTSPALFKIASTLKQWLAPFAIPLIINDHVEIAKSINADGVHLGQSDCSPEAARKILGPDKLIGLSIESAEGLSKANQLKCLNYIAASAVFPSISKHDCKMIWELDGLKKIVNNSIHPVIAIGGIQLTNVSSIIQQGAAGIAVISAIHLASHPGNMTKQLLQTIYQTKLGNK